MINKVAAVKKRATLFRGLGEFNLQGVPDMCWMTVVQVEELEF